MSREINESDWKLYRQLHPIALERYCKRVLDEIDRVVSDTHRSSHERYTAVSRLIERRDQELADTFNDLRRSTALLRLAGIQSRDLLSEEEFERFSPETREVVRSLTGNMG